MSRRRSRVERTGIWVANLVAVTILPATLGHAGPHALAFATYTVLAAVVLTCMEDARFARGLFDRADIRAYLAVRVALIGVAALPPYLIAGVLARP